MITRNGNDRFLVSGNVTMATVNALFKDGLKCGEDISANSRITIDFAQLEAVDSSAVSLMLSWLREAQRREISLSFVNVPPNLMSLAKLYGVAELFLFGNAE